MFKTYYVSPNMVIQYHFSKVDQKDIFGIYFPGNIVTRTPENNDSFILFDVHII